MTRTQRKTHLLLWFVLGPVTLAGLVFAVLWRPPVPVQPGTAPGAVSTTTKVPADIDGETLGVNDE